MDQLVKAASAEDLFALIDAAPNDVQTGPLAGLMKDGDISDLMLSVAAGDFDAVRENAKVGSGVNFQGAFGTSPLLFAAALKEPTIFRFLLDNGARIDLNLTADASVVTWAARYGSVETMAAVIEAALKREERSPAIFYQAL